MPKPTTYTTPRRLTKPAGSRPDIERVLAQGERVLAQWRAATAWLDAQQQKRDDADRLPITEEDDTHG